VAEGPAIRATAQLLRSIPGTGRVAPTPVGLLPELGTLNRRQIAALAGVAPLNQDRGVRQGPRRIWGGRAPVRTARSVAEVSGVRHTPVIRTHYRHLKAQRKPVKGAPSPVRVAC
jgi:transposase